MAFETWMPAVATPAIPARRERGSIFHLVIKDVGGDVWRLVISHFTWAGDGIPGICTKDAGISCGMHSNWVAQYASYI
jgi:hypothetical protein